MPCLLGIDAGTGRVKAGLFDATAGRWVGFASRPVVTRRFDNRAEQDSGECWAATCEVIGELRQCHPAAIQQITGIALTGQMRGLILVDRDGSPLAPALTLHDRRAFREADEFIQEFGLQKIHRETGQRLDAGSAAARLRWLHRHQQPLLDQSAAILSHKDYLRFRLTGDIATDATDAAGWVLYDLTTGGWHDDLCRFAGLEAARLPPIHPAASMPGRLLTHVAAELGLPEDAAVVVGAGDDIAATGSGALERGDVFEHIGSTGSVFAVSDRPIFDPSMVLECYPTERAGVYWIGGSCDGAGTAISAALSGMMGSESNANHVTPDPQRDRGDAEYWERVARMLADWDRELPSSRPVYLPFIGAERCPLWHNRLQGGWFDRRAEHTREQLTLAVYEGVACLLAWILQEVERAGVAANAIHSAGKGGENPDYGRMRATLYRRPVQRTDAPDAAVFAAVLIAAVAIGEVDSVAAGVRRWSRTVWIAEPRIELIEAIGERLRDFQRYARILAEA